MKIIINLIRRNLYLYIVFINIYKKFIFCFAFIEKKNYLFLKSKKIKNVLDIGSNNFQISKIILSINKQIKIICFDANIFLKKKKHKNILFYNFGLSSTNKQTYLHIPFYKGYMLDSLSSVKKSFITSYLDQHNINKNKIEIKSIPLEFSKLDNKQYNFQFVKIDVEGSELDILKGAKSNLIRNNPIILVEKNLEFTDISKLLSSMNYKTYAYNYKINEFTHKIDIDEKNIFFLNKNSFKYLE